MKLTNNYNINWSIFNIVRQKSGKYFCNTSIDAAWLEKHTNRINQSDKKITYIVADTFAKLVYGCTLTKKQARTYKENVKKYFKDLENFADIYYESEVIERIWSKDDYLQEYNSFTEKADLITIDILKAEMEKRKVMYNPFSYEIKEEELKQIAIKALASFKAEESLLSRIRD